MALDSAMVHVTGVHSLEKLTRQITTITVAVRDCAFVFGVS